MGLTGEVYCIPLLVHAREDVPNPEHSEQTMIPKGEAFYVLHYLGKGYWLCWSKGRLVKVEDMSDSGPFPKPVWWVEIETSTGLTGWTVSSENFKGQDRLG